MDVDLEVAKKQSSENPVYYVQYAHARIASILRKAADAGLAAGTAPCQGSLAGAPEGTLARIAARLPEVVEDAAAAQETQGVTTYATELATAFHAFYRDARVVDPGRAGPLGAAARPRGCDANLARERARRCSGSPRPSRCSRAGPPPGAASTPAARRRRSRRRLPGAAPSWNSPPGREPRIGQRRCRGCGELGGVGQRCPMS